MTIDEKLDFYNLLGKMNKTNMQFAGMFYDKENEGQTILAISGDNYDYLIQLITDCRNDENNETRSFLRAFVLNTAASILEKFPEHRNKMSEYINNLNK